MLTIYVPAQSDFGILPGSAIVGPSEGDPIIIDFEGNRFATEQFKSYESRLQKAADRHVTQYPTIARKEVGRKDFAAVGSTLHIKGVGWIITQISMPDALGGWLGDEALPALYGSRILREDAVGHAIDKGRLPTRLGPPTKGDEIDRLFEAILRENGVSIEA